MAKSKKERFFRRYQELIPDFQDFWNALNRPLSTTIRINTLKVDKNDVLSLLKDCEIKPLAWYEDGYTVIHKNPIGNRLEHFLGYIYAQEAASMIPVLVLRPRPNEIVLDMAAAPGSKTTQIAQFMNNTGLIIANDLSTRRIRGLRNNLDRTSVVNAMVMSWDGKQIGRRMPEFFDRVLVDAPCSSEGILRKSPVPFFRWSERTSQRLARIQKGLIVSAFRSLKKKGVLVYSTCTFAPEENEAVVDYLLHKFDSAHIEKIDIPNLKVRSGISTWQNTAFDTRVEESIRVYPQDNDTCGFFVARIRKE